MLFVTASRNTVGRSDILLSLSKTVKQTGRNLCFGRQTDAYSSSAEDLSEERRGSRHGVGANLLAASSKLIARIALKKVCFTAGAAVPHFPRHGSLLASNSYGQLPKAETEALTSVGWPIQTLFWLEWGISPSPMRAPPIHGETII
jgi:hypothetical protein